MPFAHYPKGYTVDDGHNRVAIVDGVSHYYGSWSVDAQGVHRLSCGAPITQRNVSYLNGPLVINCIVCAASRFR